MSGQTGFNYEVMISRLHGGLCAFQSLRAHRRQREQPAAPPPMTEERLTSEPPRAPRVAHVDERAEMRATGSLEPQAFVAVGDRVVPLFGNVNASLFGAMAAPASPMPPPSVTSATPTAATPAPVAEEPPPPAPAPAASTLRLPPPTPPPRLGLIYGGRPHPPEPPLSAAAEPSTATPRPPTGDTPAAPRPQDPASPPTGVQAQDAPKLAPLAALLDARAQEDAQRLEKAHAEHRLAMTMLMREHRDDLRAQSEAAAARTTDLLREVFAEHRAQLRAQSEADAARTTDLLREVLTGHRAELARANQAHADHLSQVLAQNQPTDSRAAAGDGGDLRAALLEHASLQREANEEVADHIAALTTIVADLGQTVGMLAVAATHKAQQSQLPIRGTFTPPPRVEPATLVASAGSPQSEPATPVASGESPQIEPATTKPPAAASAVEPAAPVSANAATAAATQSLPESSVSNKITEEPAQQRPIRLTLPQEAAERARLQSALDDDEDDGDLAPGLASDDDDDPMRAPRLPPITAIPRPGDQERDDD